MGPDRRLGSLMAKYLEDLIAIDCPVCRSSDATQVGSRSRGRLAIRTVVCKGCGLIYLNPKPSPGKYHEFYASGDYRRFLESVKGRDGTRGGDSVLADGKFEKRKADGRDTAQRYFKGILGRGDLYFDFGCDLGGLMAGVAEETGCEFMGNEPSEPCAAYIRDKLGIVILNSTMEEIRDEDRKTYSGRVKVGSIIGVLEHVNDPLACLKIVSDMLVADGCLYVESFDIFKRMQAKTEGIDDIATIDHQYYFHKDVYLFMLERCGFDAIRFDYAGRKGDMMRVLARKKSRNVLPDITYDPKSDVIPMVVRLNEAAARYHRSVSFALKEMKNSSIRRTRRLGEALLARFGKR